jgi:hypothetical protein
MSSSVKALLVFCEGPHDAAFVRMVFKKILGFRIARLKFSEMPSPFNALFSTAVQNHAARDMSLDRNLAEYQKIKRCLSGVERQKGGPWRIY